VFVSLTGGRRPAFYREDDPPEMADKHPLARRVNFLVSQERGLNLLLAFVNPLRHAFAASEVVVADPNYAAVNKLAESFTALANTLNISSAVESPVAAVTKNALSVQVGAALPAGTTPATLQAFAIAPNAPAKMVAPLDRAEIAPTRPATGATKTLADSARRDSTTTEVAVRSLLFPQVYSPELVLWTLLAADEERLPCLGVKPEVSQRLLNAAGDADAYMYAGSNSAGDASRPAMMYRRIASGIPRTLLRPNELRTFRVALDTVSRSRDSLQSLDKSSEGAIKAFVTAVESFADGLSQGTTPCRNFATYTRGVAGNFETAARSLLASRLTSTAAIGETINDLTKYVQEHGTKDDVDAFRLKTVEVPSGEMKDVNIVVQRRTVDTTGGRFTLRDDTADTLTIRVRRKQSFVAEFAPGVAYLKDIGYPRFGTGQAGGAMVVQSGDVDVQRTTVIGMLNLLTPTVMGPVVPGIQLGIGSGRDYPLVMAGGVLRFLSAAQFSVSAGVALPWYKELKSLKVGDQVQGTAEIEQDLRFRLGRGSMYLGIQKSF
jgi:hypothetical protein